MKRADSLFDDQCLTICVKVLDLSLTTSSARGIRVKDFKDESFIWPLIAEKMPLVSRAWKCPRCFANVRPFDEIA
jgi:hypothetical protein